jgi:hypothetical protein
VKQRILSRHGHLSCDCNDHELAIGAVRSRLGVSGAMEIVCMSQIAAS